MKKLITYRRLLPNLLRGIFSTIIVVTLAFSPLVPHQTPEVSASLVATEITQLANLAQNQASALEDRIQTATQASIAGNTLNAFIKDNVLDGIAWALAKQTLSTMVQSLINWVNSGFNGSPAFITDLRQELFNVMDQAAGEFLVELMGSDFVCSPFQLDIEVALRTNLAQAQSGMPSGPDQNLCTASDIGSNIEGFLSGTANSSWQDWFEVTANPQNTPLGAYYAAEASLNARLINEAGDTLIEANWGDGFLSQKVCETIEGGGENCTITTPGQVISEALTFSTTVGPRSLIEADEINELVSALLNQLIVTALDGANGLLGLGGNPAYADYDEDGNTYLDNMVTESGTINNDLLAEQISSHIALETVYLSLIDQAISQSEAALVAEETTPPNDDEPDTVMSVTEAVADARSERDRVLELLEKLAAIQNSLNNSEDDALGEYNLLLAEGSLSTEASITGKYEMWSTALPNLTPPNFDDTNIQG